MQGLYDGWNYTLLIVRRKPSSGGVNMASHCIGDGKAGTKAEDHKSHKSKSI
jgi:hypothetical protein